MGCKMTTSKMRSSRKERINGSCWWNIIKSIMFDFWTQVIQSSLHFCHLSDCYAKYWNAAEFWTILTKLLWISEHTWKRPLNTSLHLTNKICMSTNLPKGRTQTWQCVETLMEYLHWSPGKSMAPQGKT